MENQEIDYLFEAVKGEVAFQARENGIDLDESAIYDIASLMVFDRDWSSFNEWIMEEIRDYLKEEEE